MSPDDQDVRVAAAELGVSAPFLVDVLSRRGLHIKTTPKRAERPRRFVPTRQVVKYAVDVMRRHAKVSTKAELTTGLRELADFLETEI